MQNEKNPKKEAANYRAPIAFLKEGCYPVRYYPVTDKTTEPGKYTFKGKVGELHGKIRRV